MNAKIDIDWEEAFQYRAGLWVELKASPGVFDLIASYEADMVPPIWLVNDPQPRYSHELRLVQQPILKFSTSTLKVGTKYKGDQKWRKRKSINGRC